MGVKDFLSGISWNGTSLSDFGDAEFGSGGMTELNAGAGFGQLLEQLSAPGGVLSDEHTSKQLAGAISGLQGQREQSNTQTVDALVSGGVNPAMARRILAGQEDQFANQASGMALQVGQQAAGQEAEFMTQLVNALSQSESAQKNLELQDYWNNKMFKQQEKSAKFSQLMGWGSLLLGGGDLALGMFGGGGDKMSGAQGAQFGAKTSTAFSSMFGQPGTSGGGSSGYTFTGYYVMA